MGASGSWIHDNLLVSSSKVTARAAIAMVDPAYDYDGVRVYSNKIRGSKLLHVGIAIGSHIFPSGSDQSFAQGPVTISDNEGNGRIGFGFLMAVNGWGNGLNAGAFKKTEDDGRRTLTSSFVIADKCDAFVKDAIVQSTNYPYWNGGLEGGPNTLAEGFYPMKGNDQNFDCMQPAKLMKTYKRGGLDLAPARNGYVCNFSDVGVTFNHFAVSYMTRADGLRDFYGESCGQNNDCRLKFTSEGEFVKLSAKGESLYTSSIKGKGETLECLGEYPYLRIRDAGGNEIWKLAKEDLKH